MNYLLVLIVFPSIYIWVFVYYFTFRLHNKGVYFKIGVRKMMINRRSCKYLNQAMRLEVDGKTVDLPPVEGIIILNILRLVSLQLRINHFSYRHSAE